MKDEIDKISDSNDILSIPSHKGIYHLCLATSYLSGEELDTDLLRDLKAICRQEPSVASKQFAIDTINKGLVYIKSFPIDIEEELKNLYNDFCEKARTLNFNKVEL